MKRAHVYRSVPPLLLAASALQAGSASAATTHTYKGPLAQMGRWGQLQVTITVKSKKITKVGVSATTDTSRSSFLLGRAVPLLKQETLAAQNANIDAVSGATDVSAAYVTSLQGAIARARRARTLQ